MLFSLGLIISQMSDPAKVLRFLDIYGNWDPSLALVMAAAVAVAAAGFAWLRTQDHPRFAARFGWPPKGTIDTRLVIGSAIFGIGWGLYGLCPGPALSNLISHPKSILVFVVMMVIGLLAAERVKR